MLKKFKIILASLVFVLFGVQGLAYAQGTIIPSAKGTEDCETLLTGFAQNGYTSDIAKNNDQLLGCAVITGKISLDMVPYFIKYISNYILGLVSLISLLFVTIGGFLWASSGLTPDKKERGKTYITNALFGMGIAFLAWSIVSVIIAAITG